MPKFTQIPVETFKQLQINAGMLLKNFDPTTGPVEADKLGATTGGINFTATPTYSDFGEDIDNCPKNVEYVLEDAGIFREVPINNECKAVAFQKVSTRFIPFIPCGEIVRQMCAKKRSGRRWQVSGKLRGRTAQRIRSPCQWAETPKTSRSGTLRPGNPSGP